MTEADGGKGPIAVDGIQASSLDFVRNVDGNRVTYDLRLFMGRKVVHRVKGVDANEMVHTLGEQNAGTVHRMPGERGRLGSKELQAHDGLSPSGQAAVIEEAVDQEAVERRKLQAEPGMSPERLAFLQQQTARAERGDTTGSEKIDQTDRSPPAGGGLPKLDAEEVAQRRAAQMEALKKQFILVNNQFFYKDRANKLAFEDRGGKLVTAEKDSTVAAAMTKMAEAKGWTAIKVSGTHEFKRQLWVEASAAGLKVQGYSPTDADKAALQQLRASRATNTVEQGVDREPSKAAGDTAQPTKGGSSVGDKMPSKEAIEELRKRKQRGEDFDQLKEQNREGIPKAAVVGRVAAAILELKVKNPETRQRVMSEVQGQLDKMAAGGKVPTLHTYDRNSPAKARDIDKVRPEVERRAERVR
ncbi:hypothetical protein K6X12_06550 [Xanthomonas euvesicatoria pv. allii]|uniref:LPD7 domain-containing protein n=1 Tax=Xanthomonas euvesicatoria TaxID=456327 RepID=UPI002405D76C|nr:LPD7 domain-containing protein [Xanthomonas euvesicatoria]MCP3050757.1 hypothetical protein [Xanthomonas euvesicatoria pv. allii]